MNIAIIPWNDTFLQDKIFGEVDPSINYDDRLTPLLKMKKEFEKTGKNLRKSVDKGSGVWYYT